MPALRQRAVLMSLPDESMQGCDSINAGSQAAGSDRPSRSALAFLLANAKLDGGGLLIGPP